MKYLASPYTDISPAVMEDRYHAVCKVAAVLFAHGHNVVSPIAHSHALVAHGAPTAWPDWSRLDYDLLRHSEALWVLMLPGWRESVGVTAEIAMAVALHIPIKYVYPLTCGVSEKPE